MDDFLEWLGVLSFLLILLCFLDRGDAQSFASFCYHKGQTRKTPDILSDPDIIDSQAPH